MCGRYNVTDSPEVRALMAMLGLPINLQDRLNIAPGAFGQFVIEQEGERKLLDGIWSLLIEPNPDHSGYRPNPKYSTFNARFDKLSSCSCSITKPDLLDYIGDFVLTLVDNEQRRYSH